MNQRAPCESLPDPPDPPQKRAMTESLTVVALRRLTLAGASRTVLERVAGGPTMLRTLQHAYPILAAVTPPEPESLPVVRPVRYPSETADQAARHAVARMARVRQIVCKRFELRVRDLVAPKRSRGQTKARGAFCALARACGGTSTVIADLVERDHSTVFYFIAMHTRRMSNDDYAMRYRLAEIEAKDALAAMGR